MESSQTFKFSTEQLKKINAILPKGFKFIPRDELQKREIQKPVARRKGPASFSSQGITPPQPKVKLQKEEEYQPQKKTIIRPPPIIPVIPIDQEPAGTSLKLLERIKKHPAYSHLIHFSKTNQSESSLRDIEDKASKLGELYQTNNLELDLQNFFLMVYKWSVKTSTDYRLAAQLENHLFNLMKVQRAGEPKRGEILVRGGGGRKRVPPVRVYLPLASYKPATAMQKRLLGMMIRKLSSEHLQQVIYIMFESSEVKEYIFDLDNIHIKKFRELQQFVKKCMEKAGDWDPRTMEDEEFSNQSEFIIDTDDS